MQLWHNEATKMLPLKAMNPIGSLQVSVVEGRKLAPKQADGTLDSYVVLELEHEQVRTDVMLHNLNPDWLADFKLSVRSEDSRLLVFVHEARSPQGSGLIGKASVGLREFVDVGTNVQWVILKDANGVYAGEVCLVLRYTRTLQIGAKTDVFDLRFPGVTKASRPASPREGSPRRSTLHKTPNSSVEGGRSSTRASQLLAPPPPPREPEVREPPPNPHELQVSRPPAPPPLPRNKLLAIAGAAAAAALLLATFAIKYRNQRRRKQDVNK